MDINKVSIIGLGALGIMYGNYIAQKVPEHTLRIIADKERITKYLEEGIYCNEDPCIFSYMAPEVMDPADLLIFCVKFGQLKEAMSAAKNQVGEHTVILSTLNGISSEEYLSEAFGKDKVLLCTAQGMDAVKEGNHMVYHNLGHLCIGTWDGQSSEELEAVTLFFDRITLPYRLPKDMIRQLWNKLMLNVGVNQAVTVYETNYGGIQKDGEPREIMQLAMKEVLALAQAIKINLTIEDITNWDIIVGSLDPEGLPSMRQDVLAGRPTEVELFSGTINRLGKQYHIKTPVNEMLYDRIKAIETGFIGNKKS